MSTPPSRKEKSSLFVLAMALPFPVLFLLAGAGSAASPRAASLPLLVAALFLAALSSLSLALAIRLRQSREQIQTVQQLLSAQSDFLARMSHDMRTPLNAIVGLTALAQDEPGNPAATGAYLSQIASSAKYLQSLAGDVLDISRIESGELELHPAPYPLSEFEEAVRALAVPLCAEKKQRFTFMHSKEWPTLFVDRVRFNQIFFNLLSNAVKYTPEGGSVDFEVRIAALANGRLSLEGCVRDTGIGIPKEHQQKVFERFYRVDKSRSKATGGTGLGLSIVKHAVQLLGGELRLESNPGQGTTMTVLL